MVDSTATPPARPPRFGWCLALYPRLSRRARRRLAAMFLVATLAAPPAAGYAGAGAREARGAHPAAPLAAGSAGTTAGASCEADPNANPVVRKALRELGLNAPAAPQAPAAPAAMDFVSGAQFEVNTYTTSNQRDPVVVQDADGDFVIVWESNGSGGTDTSGLSIQGRRYNSEGTAIGSQFQVNTVTTGDQHELSLAVDADGDFVVVWESYSSGGSDTDGYSIQGQRFNSAGTAVGSQFQVNTYTTDDQRDPSVAADADGDFVVVWASDGSSGTDTNGYSIQGQRFSSAGAAVGSQFQVNTYTTNYQIIPSVALDADGDFVVVWESYGSGESDTTGYSIQGRRYNSAGSAVGSQFQVNTYTTSSQRRPAVAVDADGDLVVAWDSSGSGGTDNDNRSIQGQRYNSAGTAVGSEFQINTFTTGTQRNPSVAVDADGDFVVSWHSSASGGSDGDDASVHVQRFDSSGTTQGNQFQVNTYTTSTQSFSSVALDANGDFLVVVWNSLGSGDSDTDGYSIQAAGFDLTPSLDQVNTYTTSDQRYPSVALDADGDFVVVWHSAGSSGSDTSGYSVQGQRYDASGAAQGSEFQVNTYTTSHQESASVALDADGDFVVAWQSSGSSGSDTDAISIQGQRYSSGGATQGSEFQVNSYTTGTQSVPAVARDADGDFVVAWQSSYSGYGDSSLASVQGQRFDSAGTAQGSQFQVNTYTTNSQALPSLGMAADGDFVVTWHSDGSSGGDVSIFSVQVQRYNAAGTVQGNQFQVNTYTTNNQGRPSVALDTDGDLVVAWESNGVVDQPSPHFLVASEAPTGPTGLDADDNYGIVVSRFQSQGGPLPTAITLAALSAEARGGGIAAALAGLGAVVGGWWFGRRSMWRPGRRVRGDE